MRQKIESPRHAMQMYMGKRTGKRRFVGNSRNVRMVIIERITEVMAKPSAVSFTVAIQAGGARAVKGDNVDIGLCIQEGCRRSESYKAVE